MKTRIFLSSLLMLASTSALAQDALNSIVRSSTSSKTAFAAFDVRPTAQPPGALEEAIAAAFRKHYDGIKVTQQMAPYPLPAYAPRMTFHQEATHVGQVSVPDCPDASAVITSSDKSLAKYGETSVLQACVFPYRDGYRVNVYALFVQKTGGADIGALSGMLGRAVTNWMGIGDSSRFIGETVDEVETRLKGVAGDVALVELQPARPDKAPVADRAAPAPAQTAPVAAAARAATLPPQLAAIQAQIGAALAQQGMAQARPADGDTGALQARKELSAMGLAYYSQEQFIEAARRGDRLACELYLRAGSVKAAQADKHGITAIKAAATPELATFIATFL